MADHLADDLDSPGLGGEVREKLSQRPHDSYGCLCDFEHLRRAYEQLKEDSQALGLDVRGLEAIETAGVEDFLRRLSQDLRSRRYEPSASARRSLASGVTRDATQGAVRDQIVEIALKLVLDSLFPTSLPCDPDPEAEVKWVAQAIDRGLTRVYTATIAGSLKGGQRQSQVERVVRESGGPDLAEFLKTFLSHGGPRNALAPVIENIVYHGIDKVLRQAESIGRHDGAAQVACARVDQSLVMLVDRDSRLDWLLPAVDKRVCDALSEIDRNADPPKTQTADLASGETLEFQGYEVSLLADSRGRPKAQYQRLGEAVDAPDSLPTRAHRTEPAVTSVAKPESARMSPGDDEPTDKADRWSLVQAFRSLRLPWHFSGLDVTRTADRSRLGRWGQFIEDVVRNVLSLEVGWRHLPITLYPVVALISGWRSPLSLVCAGLIVVCNWRSIPAVWAFARRRWLDLTIAACGGAALVLLGLLVSDLYANRSHETAAQKLPPGFYLGQYNRSWDAEPVKYGLYLPPQHQTEDGQLPMIVQLHGYGERNADKVFLVGIPQSIIFQFGEHTRNGRFAFALFCPIDQSGRWQAGTDQVDAAMKALDYVIERHRIDPARVYLTGLSIGGDAVWRMAEAYPHRWAALVPISAFTDPDVQKVRHIPAWIVHGAKDRSAPVVRERGLVQKLEEAGADIRYTEVPNRGHQVWREVYDSKEFYDWLAKKARK